jgi:tRNA (Thr-GGU) A37 N-methylase
MRGPPGTALRGDLTMSIVLEPIATVRAVRTVAEDDQWGGAVAEIVLQDGLPEEALAGLDAFSHAEVLFHFHLADPVRIVTGARHPRNNPAWPAIGIFAQRGRGRPNRLGSTIVRVLGVSGRVLRVAELDAIDGTPVLDIKPVMREFLPRGEVSQPPWVAELMAHYWDDAPTTEREGPTR